MNPAVAQHIIRPERDRPLDKLDKLIPQPLKVEHDVHLRVELPVEARQLMADVHEDRQAIVSLAIVVVLLLTIAVARYVAGFWRSKEA